MIFAFSATILILTGGFVSSLGIGQEFFQIKLEWAKLIKDLMYLFNIVYRLFTDVIVVIFDIIMTVGAFVVGILCWVVIFGLLIILLVLIFVG